MKLGRILFLVSFPSWSLVWAKNKPIFTVISVDKSQNENRNRKEVSQFPETKTKEESASFIQHDTNDRTGWQSSKFFLSSNKLHTLLDGGMFHSYSQVFTVLFVLLTSCFPYTDTVKIIRHRTGTCVEKSGYLGGNTSPRDIQNLQYYCNEMHT